MYIMYIMSSRYLQKCLSYDIKREKQALFTPFQDLLIFLFLFFSEFDVSKSAFGSLFAFFAKI